MDSQSPLSRTLSLGPVEHAFGANYTPLASSPVQDPSSPEHRGTFAPGRQARTQVKLSKRLTRPHRRRRESNVSSDATELIIKTLSQNVLCDDYYGLLKSELPRWAREGLWPETPQKPLGLSSCSSSSSYPSSSTALSLNTSALAGPPASYLKLERAYLAVCQLDTRMSDDVVRNRIALIQLHLEYTQTHETMRRRNSSSSPGAGGGSGSGKTASTVGRGDASHVIDRILENTHGEWEALDQRRRAELRAKFHDRKKYGKRWSQLADALGPGILLVCATRLANAVRSTTVTAKMLEDTIERIKVLDPDTMNVIGVVSPLAECLLKNERFEHSEVVKVLRQLQ
ncbi:hypothetical protein Daus18300_004226 [Diaporthe australafricana]|uniref:Uncharacterized protein n=1 Tax=Diaporthe australafricana TaxID=127596 RepID=A0ABR3X9R3_9PEZI